MTDTTEICAQPDADAERAPRTSKSSTVIRLLSRNRGATIAEIMAVTHWQSHSVRAFLTGLRRKGLAILKECKTDGETSYRVAR